MPSLSLEDESRKRAEEQRKVYGAQHEEHQAFLKGGGQLGVDLEGLERIHQAFSALTEHFKKYNISISENIAGEWTVYRGYYAGNLGEGHAVHLWDQSYYETFGEAVEYALDRLLREAKRQSEP